MLFFLVITVTVLSWYAVLWILCHWAIYRSTSANYTKTLS